MQRGEEDAVVVPEDVLCSVPVMHVEVDDRHTRGTGYLLGTCSDRNVVEQTKAHRAISRRVVARWTHEREGIVRGRLDCRPRGEGRSLVARLGGRSVPIEPRRRDDAANERGCSGV